MKSIEYFITRLNGWLSISLETYLSLLFSQEENKFSKIKIPKGMPIKAIEPDSTNNDELILSPGNFVEVLIKQNLILDTNNKNGQIQISNLSNDQKSLKEYDVWTRGKIISNDTDSKLLFIEINDKIEIIDDMSLVRPLKEIRTTSSDFVAYYIKQISNSGYNSIKEEFDKLMNANSNNNKLFYIKYDIIKSSLLCFGNKNDLNNLLLLNKQEEKYKKNNNNDEQNNNSDSNPNSNNNLLGVKGPSRESEDSDKKIIIVDDEKQNEINECKYKTSFTYREKFKKDLEKDFAEIFQNCRYYIGKNNDNNFDVVVYGNNEDEYLKEKNICEKKYKQVKLDSDTPLNKNELNDLAMKSKVKYINIEKKSIYLVGEEKCINNFKTVWEMTKKYSKEIQKTSKENESIQRELQTFKKKHNLK
jgi:hypothetical protein